MPFPSHVKKPPKFALIICLQFLMVTIASVSALCGWHVCPYEGHSCCAVDKHSSHLPCSLLSSWNYIMYISLSSLQER